MENLESHGVLELNFPGLEKIGEVMEKVMESHEISKAQKSMNHGYTCHCSSCVSGAQMAEQWTSDLKVISSNSTGCFHCSRSTVLHLDLFNL